MEERFRLGVILGEEPQERVSLISFLHKAIFAVGH